MGAPSRRWIAALLLAATLPQVSGCSTWVPYAMPPASPEPQPVGADVRVTMADGRRLTMHRARLEGDALAGTAFTGADSAEARLPRDSIATVELRKTDGERSALAIVGIAAAVGLSLAMSSIDMMGD